MTRQGIDLYNIGTSPEELQSALVQLRADFDAHIHDGASSKNFETISAETISARTMLIRKTSYDDSASGIWMGEVGGTMQLKLGSASSYLQWNGSALSIVGSITATSGTIGGWTIGATTLTGGGVTLNSSTGAISGASISGGSITGTLIRTATTGRRIEMDTTNTNQIRFYDSTTLYGVLEADKVGSDGYINLVAQDDGAGLQIYTGVGASAFASASLFGNGGSVDVSGNASNSYATMSTLNGGSLVLHGGPSGDEFYLDDGAGGYIGITCHWTPTASATYDLGSSSLKWRDGFFSRDVDIGDDLTVADDFTYQSIIQPVVYYGYCSGTTISEDNNSFTLANPSTGKYTITHNFGNTNYVVVATTLKGSGAGDHVCKVESRNINDFKITTFTANDGLVGASDFMFVLLKIA